MREEAIEAPVKDAGGDEGVDIADVETAQVGLLAHLRPNCLSTLANGKIDGGKLLASGEKEGKRLTDVDRPKRP